MTVKTVDALLQQTGIGCDGVRRTHSGRTGGACRMRRVPRKLIAKTVVLVNARGYALAVIPKSRRIDLPALNAEFGRDFVPTSGEEIRRLFPDFLRRAIPPVGESAGIEMFVDRALVSLSEVYFDFETEDHKPMVRLDGESFRGLFYGSWWGHITRRVERPRHTIGDAR